MKQVDAIVREATARLTAAGVASPEHDAETLVAHALDAERPAVRTWRALGAAVDDDAVRAVTDLVDLRCARIPLQHLTGEAPFRRLALHVGPGVFVPRPESELVVEHALAAAREVQGREPVVVDLCSGSGAIALAIADEHPTAIVHAVEVDDDAVLWLQRNTAEAVRAGVRDRVVVHHADAAVAPPGLDDAVDVVTCNPPYVPDGMSIRDPEAARHDPPRALWGGADGLDVVRAVIGTAERLLRNGGLLVLEHADVQGESLPALLAGRTDAEGPCWVAIADHRDLADRPRITTARRHRAVIGVGS